AAASVLHYAGVFASRGVETAAIQYYCPMHPGVVQDEPGSCPICGMTLVARAPAGPRGSDEHGVGVSRTAAGGAGAATAIGGGGSAGPAGEHPDTVAQQPDDAATRVPGLAPITLSPERVQLMGIRTATVEHAALTGALRTVGYVAANEAALVQVHTRFAGWIQELRVART